MKTKTILCILLSLIVIMGAVSVISAKSDKDNGKKKGFLDGKNKKEIESIISDMSNKPMLYFAQEYNITEIDGKKIDTQGVDKKKDRPNTFVDRPVGADPVKHENEPSISARPNSSSVVVAATHYLYDPPCVAYRSTDGGASWSSPVNLPLLHSDDVCSDPVVRWAPDSTVVYAIYMSFTSSDSNIVVSRSTNNGQTWSTPVSAFSGSATSSVDKPWGDVHTYWNNTYTKDKLYVTTTRFNSDGTVDILFTRSLDKGLTFQPVQVLASGNTGAGPLVQGSRPVGGKYTSSTSADVLACWYNSESDGIRSGVFDIRCKVSTNYGATFGSEIVAVNDKSSELPTYLGPSSAYHRIWGGMFPSFIITPTDNVAHLVFTADPSSGSDSDDGDIFYVKSARPYTSWTPARTRVNDNTWMTQVYPTITAKKTSLGNILMVAWEDHRNSYDSFIPTDECYNNDYTNCYYDTYAATTSPGGTDWNSNPNKRVTDVSSISDFLFIGDYIDSSTNQVTTDNTAQVIWTDRSDKASYMDFEDDVYSDRLTLNN